MHEISNDAAASGNESENIGPYVNASLNEPIKNEPMRSD